MSKLFRKRKAAEATGGYVSIVNPLTSGCGHGSPLVVRSDDPRGYTITFPVTAPADRAHAAQVIRDATARHNATRPR